MKMKLLVLLGVLTAGALAAQTDGGYIPSDPSRIAATGRPQLVEFYHPL